MIGRDINHNGWAESTVVFGSGVCEHRIFIRRWNELRVVELRYTRACQQRGIKAGVGNDCSGDPTECQRAATSPSWPAASVVQPRDLVDILHC